MSSISSDEIISILKNEIENFDQISKDSEVGTVVSVGDGIANIYGIEHAMYGEIVTFENGLKGMVQDIQKDTIGCILFGSDVEIKEGTKVMRTKKKAGVPVGDKFIGRVVNALGAPIDGAGEIEAEDYRPIENEAPGIVDRKSVSVPMETGILSIDSMFPIGRGQRELIIGDRQTGKTSIATDTILNQKGKDVICIYVAIGQKASTIAKVVNTFKNGGAMDYTIVVASTASDCAPLQYIAPYAGTAIAEHFMHKGKDVLIVYDDLSKHAVAYRAPEKLLYRFISSQLVFAYDDKQTLSLNSCNLVIPKLEGLHIKYILAILNSRIAQFIYKMEFHSVKVLRSHIENIPILDVNADMQNSIIQAVEPLIDGLPPEGAQIAYEQLDQLIFKLFNLTSKEQDIIKHAVDGENKFLF